MNEEKTIYIEIIEGEFEGCRGYIEKTRPLPSGRIQCIIYKDREKLRRSFDPSLIHKISK